MKRFLTSILFVFGMVAMSHAVDDMRGSPRPALWRSSRTATADNFVLVATGAVHFHGVRIGTPSANSDISFFNSTSPATTLANFNVSTGAYMATGAFFSGQNSGNQGYDYDMFFSSGLVYNKRGTADITILWDYVTPTTSVNVPHMPSGRPW